MLSDSPRHNRRHCYLTGPKKNKFVVGGYRDLTRSNHSRLSFPYCVLRVREGSFSAQSPDSESVSWLSVRTVPLVQYTLHNTVPLVLQVNNNNMLVLPDDITILADQHYDSYCGSKVTTSRCPQIRPKYASYKGYTGKLT